MIQPKRLRQLLRQMIEIYSPSGKEEAVLEFLKNTLKRRGLPVTIQPVDDNRYNLIVAPEGPDIQLALIGHVDTVTAYDLDCFGYEEDEDMIYGLGAADMKGGCAAMIEAYLSVWEEGATQMPVALCLVVGEEETGDGAWQLTRTYHFPWAVVGEPTDLRPNLSCYGYVEVEVAASGRRVHAAMGNARTSPIKVMFRTLLKLIRHLDTVRPEVIYNIRDLFSTAAGFAVPEHCEAWLDIHVPPGIAIGDIVAELEDICQGEKVADGLNARFRNTTNEAGFILPEKGPVVEALREAISAQGLSWQPGAFPSHSDANQLWGAGIKPIVLGPGHLSQAHTEDESIAFSQVLQAATIYRDLIQRIV
ncbi:MAG: M20/M25/M40 family metallo-hydrolase [Pseudomonadota bacterium]